MVVELNDFRREFGREKDPFDIMLHCPDAENVDNIRRLEEIGVTDLQVAPSGRCRVLANTSACRRCACSRRWPSNRKRSSAMPKDIIAKSS